MIENPDDTVRDGELTYDPEKAAKIRCWEQRGCHGIPGVEGDMSFECPHNRSDCYSPCPAECKYTACRNPWHKQCYDILKVLDETVDRTAAIKQNCYTCEHFLNNGPRIGECDSRLGDIPQASTLESDTNVTLHFF